MKKIWKFFRSKKGQTSTEYILLVAVVALIVFRFKDVATTRLQQMTNEIFDKASSKIINDMN